MTVFDPWAAAEEEASPRQVQNLVSAVSGLLPDVPLDVPTVMSLIVVFAFVLQFYWTVISFSLVGGSASSSSTASSSATTTTTTTAPRVVSSSLSSVASLTRTQTVTPAPAPEWRHLHRDFALPTWVQRQRPDFHRFRIHTRQTREVEQQELRVRKDSPPLTFPAEVSWGHDHHSNILPVVPDEVEEDEKEAEKGGEDEEWQGTRPQMSIEYGVSDGAGGSVPLSMTSHRLEHGHKVAYLSEDLLHAAGRWAQRLRTWHVLGHDGAAGMAQAVRIMRCALGSAGFCAELDHYFRRQHDLNLAAAMMNDRHVESQGHPARYHFTSERPYLWNQGGQGAKQEGPVRLPQEEKEEEKEEEKGEEKRKGDVQDATLHEAVLFRRHDRVEKNNGQSLKKKSWNIYFFMSVAAILLFLMDAFYRILRLVLLLPPAGGDRDASPRGTYHDPMVTLAEAIRRWDQH